MRSEIKLVAGALTTLALATTAMVVTPFLQLKDVPPPTGLAPYTAQQLRGRQVYIENGCLACHTQQASATGAGRADAARGWGRPAVAADYFHDQPPLLGTMRTGPDLFNVGDRIKARDWHLGHLYQPRAFVPASTMPAYPFLFEEVVSAEVRPGDYVVPLPDDAVPPGRKVVPTRKADDLVAYLLSLQRGYAAPPPSTDAAASKAVASAMRDAARNGDPSDGQ